MKPVNASLALLLLVSIYASQGTNQPLPLKPATRGSLIRRRMEWFYRQRAQPFKHIPAGARLRALEHMDRMLAEQGALPDSDASSIESGFDISAAATSSTRWTLIGPEPTDTPYNVPIVAGRIAALAVDPTNANVVYAGAAGGGVWKTTDGGVHWRPLTDAQPSLAVGSIAIDPLNHSTIYVGTGEENFSGDSYYGAGILKSTDGGSSWTQMKGPFAGPFGEGGGDYIGGLAINPENTSVILAAGASPQVGYAGVWRSEDGGTTWNGVLPNNTNPLPFNAGTGVLFDPTDGNIAYAAIYFDGVYKSLDAGKTWARLNGTGSNLFPTQNVGRIALAMAPSNSSTIYAGVQSTLDFRLLGLYKTTDGGAHWIKLANAPNYCDQQCWYDQAIAVQPNNPNVVFAGGAFGGGTANSYRSTDGGAHWTNVTEGANGFFLHADLHALAFSADSSVIYAGNDGGVWRASPPTATPMPWTELNDSLAITQFYFSASINPKDSTNSFAGTQDNGSQQYRGTLAWQDVVCGDGGWTILDPVTSGNVYSTCPKENGLVWKSANGGIFGSWSLAVNGIDQTEPELFLPPLAIDPLHPSNLYFGTSRVYQTTNEAANWTAISGDLTEGGGAPISTIAVAPTDSNTVYTGSSDLIVQMTTNALAGTGAVWKDRSANLQQLLHYHPLYITQLAVDPHSSTTAYVTISGFFHGHVFRTADGGVTWKDISGNLPNIPVNGIAIDPALANTYYVATDIGVFRTRNGGTTWSVFSAGLPRVVVMGVTLHSASRTLRAATHGRSMWDIHVPIADLATVVTEGPNPVLHGTNLTYTLNVTNKGPDIAPNTVISDITPIGTTFVKFTTSVGTCSAPSFGVAGTLNCKVGNVGIGAKVTVTMTVKDTVAAGSTLRDVGRAFSATPDPKTSNNSMTIKTSVD